MALSMEKSNFIEMIKEKIIEIAPKLLVWLKNSNKYSFKPSWEVKNNWDKKFSIFIS